MCALPTNGTIIKLKVLPAVAAGKEWGTKSGQRSFFSY